MIVDDEQTCISLLRMMLAEYCPDVEVAATACSIEEGYGLIRQTDPDLVFLDVKMPDKEEGFRLLDLFEGRHRFKVILCTGHFEFGPTSYNYDISHYLKKPVNFEALITAVNKVRKELGAQPVNRQVKPLLVSYRNADFHLVQELIRPEDIILMQSKSGKTAIHYTGGRSTEVSKPLKEIRDEHGLLNLPEFMKWLDGYLINLRHFTSFNKHDGCVCLAGNHKIYISKNKRTEFEEELRNQLDKMSR